MIELPETSRRKWYNRGYHGTLHHDVWAAFTEELGMADGDPVSLHSHTPVDSAKRYVDLIGADAILAAGVGRTRLPTTGGPRRSCTSWSSTTRTTWRLAMFKPTPSSRWATRSRDRGGAASSLRLPGSSAKASSPPTSAPSLRT